MAAEFWFFAVVGAVVWLVAWSAPPPITRRLRRRRLHSWFRYAVVTSGDGYSRVLDEYEDAPRVGDQVLRRGLAQGQAYFLSMALNDALKEADRAIEANDYGA